MARIACTYEPSLSSACSAHSISLHGLRLTQCSSTNTHTWHINVQQSVGLPFRCALVGAAVNVTRESLCLALHCLADSSASTLYILQIQDLSVSSSGVHRFRSLHRELDTASAPVLHIERARFVIAKRCLDPKEYRSQWYLH